MKKNIKSHELNNYFIILKPNTKGNINLFTASKNINRNVYLVPIPKMGFTSKLKSLDKRNIFLNHFVSISSGLLESCISNNINTIRVFFKFNNFFLRDFDSNKKSSIK